MTADAEPIRIRAHTTIEDVAAEAAVSVATVSRALRDMPNVAPATRDRVVEIANRLGYRADPAASRLAAGRTRTVAIAVPVVNSWYFSQTVGGAEAALSARGYDLLVMAVTGDDARHRFLRDATSMHRRADGLILVDLRVPEDEAVELAASGLRVITIGFRAEAISSVMLDDEAVGHEATSHLLGLGHRRIGLIEGLPDDELRFAVPSRRRRGFERALADYGLEFDSRLATAGDFSVRGGEKAMARLLSLGEPPTAVFAMSDEMAMGALKVARDTGLDVPGDLSVVGVDDHDLAYVMDLTTVRQDVAENGATAACWIMDALDRGVDELIREVPATRLVVRGTTGAPRH